MSGAIFLDRDGVLNRKPPEGAYVTAWSGFRFLPGVVEALASLAARTRRPMFVVTNQRGIALGRTTAAAVDDISARMTQALGAAGVTLGGIEVCPHDLDICDCRKPGVGMFMRILDRCPALDLADSVMIGDSLADVEAAERLGIRAFVVGPDHRAISAAATAAGWPVAAAFESLPSLVGSGALDDAEAGQLPDGPTVNRVPGAAPARPTTAAGRSKAPRQGSR